MASIVTNSAYGIINDAMHDAGLLQEGELANSDQLASNLRRLNDILNLWQTQGLKLFLQEDITVPLAVGQTLYVLGPTGPAVVMPKPSRILSAFVLTTSNVRRPLVILSRDDWERLSQVTGNNGVINSFFVDKQSYAINLNVWPPPDSTEAANTLSCLTQTQVLNPIFLTDGTAFPQEWRIALRWGLADDICTGQPMAVQQRCSQRATAYRTVLEDWDVEDAPTSFAVDSRMFNNYGRFR